MPKERGSRSRLTQAALSTEYRQHLRQAGRWLVDVVVSLGGVLSPSMSPQSVDRWLEKAVGHAYEMGKDGTGWCWEC